MQWYSQPDYYSTMCVQFVCYLSKLHLQLTNHGVEEAVAQLIKDSTVEFFSLPLDIKNKVAVLGTGDGLEGYGHHYSRGPGDKLDWAEGLILITQPVQERNMELWPTNPPTFRSASYIQNPFAVRVRFPRIDRLSFILPTNSVM